MARLSALYSVDAFGGGLLADALISCWFFRRFGVSEQGLGLLAAIHILNAISHQEPAWLARRIGLVNTMVFTHLPSNKATPLRKERRSCASLDLAQKLYRGTMYVSVGNDIRLLASIQQRTLVTAGVVG